MTHARFLSFSSCFPSLPCRLSCNKHRPFAMAALSDDHIREWILSEGKATQITKVSPVGGGCINLASHYDTDAGYFFVKTNRTIGPSMFEGEALGLGAMYETRTIRVPRPFKTLSLGVSSYQVLWVGALPTGGSYIIMEFFEFGFSRGDQSVLGRKLAEMHKVGKSSKDGHNEAEFGMSWCAGFGGSFYNSYFEVMSKQPDFEKKRDLYMLYHYLNHYNLFGSGYRSSSLSIIDDYLRMLEV